ncbi:MAG: hypothetical protein ACJASQ_000803 [Crocinitomicaceae bacterium]|jgi:hypothetical protein
MNAKFLLVLFLGLSSIAYSQTDETTKVSNVTIELVSGETIVVGEDDECSISFSAYSNYINYKKSGAKKYKGYYAKIVKEVTYSINGETITLNQFRGPGSKYVLLETVHVTDAVTLYRGPLRGGSSHHYYLSQKKPGRVEVMFRASPKTFSDMLRCKAIGQKFELNKLMMEVEAMKELLDYYNSNCGG